MSKFLTRPVARFLANLFTNLDATWIAATAISPNFVGFENPEAIQLLFRNIFFVILLSLLAVKLEHWVDNYE